MQSATSAAELMSDDAGCWSTGSKYTMKCVHVYTIMINW